MNKANNLEFDGSTVQEIASLAQQAALVDQIDVHSADNKGEAGIAGILVPRTHEWRNLTAEIEQRRDVLAPGPRRIVAREHAETLDGFIRLSRRHAGQTSAVEALLRDDRDANKLAPRMRTVVDYHGASAGDGPDPRWGKHEVCYAFPLSAKCAMWMQAGTQFMSKRDFLRFVQDNVSSMQSPDEVEADPGSITRTEFEAVLLARGMGKAERESKELTALFGTPGQLVEGARAMGAISSEEFDEVESGLGEVEVRYRKSDKSTNSEKVREFYLVSVSVFDGEPPQTLPARLRITVSQGVLGLRLEVMGLQLVIERAFAAACERVERETGLPLYRCRLG